jgi:hypothetical protein
MRRVLASLLSGLGACTLLLDGAEHQGGPPGAPDAAANLDGSSGDASADGSVGGPCDMDEDGHRKSGACGGDDCDDGRGDVHPGAVPVCGDGVVNDCAFVGDASLARQIMGSETDDGELGIVTPLELARVPSPAGVRTLALAMAPAGDGGGGIWIAHVAGQAARQRVPALLHAAGDAPAEFTSLPFPAPAVAFRDVATVALGTGEGEPTAAFALFASKAFDADADGVADTSGWVGTLGPAAGAGSTQEVAPGKSTQAKLSPRAVILGGSVVYREHYTARFEARTATSHVMGAFTGSDLTSYRDVATDAQGIVGAGGMVEVAGTRGPHLLLHEPGSAEAYLWGYLGDTALREFSLSPLLASEVTGRPGLAYLGQMSNVDSYALLATGRGKLAAALVECPEKDPGACALGVNGTTFSIPLASSQDEALSVSASTMRESSLVAALTRIRPSGRADEHLDLILLGLSGVLRQFTVLPEGFAGQGKRVLDAQIASMQSTLTSGHTATTIGYAALLENDSDEDELYYGVLRACDER